jgi:hypothetical protein
MIASVGTILLVFGLVCAILAAIFQPIPPGTPAWGRVHLGWLAIAFLIAAMIFGGIKL